jgi:riboflavin biosynthesis pyrimidine reductase
MLSPLDGRLLVDGWAPEGSALRDAVIGEYEELHKTFDADAWIAGTNTMEEFATGKPRGVPTTDTPPNRPWHLADPTARRFAIAIDRQARLHWDKPVADNGHVVVVLASTVSNDHLAELTAGGISYLVMPSEEIDLADMLAQLYARLDIRKVLLEGGAKLDGAFLEAGLVDEISLLLCPAIDGRSGGPAIFEAGDKSLGQALKLSLSGVSQMQSGAVHLRYEVTTQDA